ncbi:hypothetical protein PSACC_03678 [Paramicrosporidium saccamoebae]|uniref:General negative regulator of transcription subunit 1 n=1 Tax=Paramicrosporidium saccamoebae TaxID=1246581 RepID=A0A2H9TFC5_9FUNG|nr:hypothetical protein PSACC_03678 [Paramicrosporidium saccamoebae]
MEPGYLAKVLADLGPESCDRNMFLDILQQLKPMLQGGVENPVALALIYMCQPNHPGNLARSPLGAWNTSVFGSAVFESFPKIDINAVICCLDKPHFNIVDPRGAELLVRALRAITKDFYSQVQVKHLMKSWSNIKGQLNLIFNCLLLPPDILNLSMLVGKKVIATEDFTNLSPAARNIAATLGSQTWNCAELFEFTAQVIDTDNFEEAKPIFELASRQCPELLCIALASMDPTWNSINKEILVKLTCGFILGQPSSTVVLPRVWSLNPNVLLFCMVEMHRRDSTCLSRLLDVAQELKILPIILDAKPYSFTLDLACLASRRQHLNIEKWLAESIKDKGDLFLRAAVDFIADKIALQYNRPRSGTSGPVSGMPASPEVITLFIKQLHGVFAMMAPDVAEQFREIHRLSAQESGNPGAISGISMTERGGNIENGSLPEMTFASDIEEEVNNFFDRIFAREVAANDVIEVLRRLKGSASIRDQQVFACFLHNIFDEYRFFGKYPDNELNLTAVLFGQLINCGLVAYVPLGLALRCVLDALRKPPGQKLFRFGVQAIMQFHTRLAEWPQYCAHLMQIPHLQQVYPELYVYIRSCLSGGQAPPALSTPPISPPAPASPVQPVVVPPPSQVPPESGNPLIEAAEKQKYPAPSEGVRDRILFILNNLSINNLEHKANDLVKVLEEVHFAWLAQYLVVRRASLEPNYHSLYLELLGILQISTLTQQVLSQTYSNIYILLHSSKIIASTSERSLLKNLGIWLGGLTLARDQPILHKDLNMKELLIEAFTSDRLIAIVPFVCKVTEQCIHSRAFQPENPWLMAILKLLAELYNFADLKLNLKFEIEVLCKNLQVELHSLEPSSLLKQKSSVLLRPGVNLTDTAEDTILLSGPDSPLVSLVVLNSRLGSPRINNVLRRLTAIAVEYAIRDVVLSVTQRSLQNALATTRAVAGKDFSGEVDNIVYKQAASNMASALTSSMAVVLGRESLKGNLINNLRLFSQWASMGHLIPDMALEDIADDNMDLASAYIEKIALERSRPQIEAVILSEIDSRPRSSGTAKISAEQLRAYDEFARKSRPAHLAALPFVESEPASPEELERLAQLLSSASNIGTSIQGKSDGGLLSPGVPAVDGSLDAYFESVCLKFVDLVAAIEKITPSVPLPEDTVSKLPPSHEIRSLMKQIVLLASSSPIHRDELCLLMSQRLMQGLYKTESPLYVDVIILLLIKIFEFSSKAAKEVTTWVVHSTDERKYSVLATAALFGSGLIYVLDFDGQLAKQIDAGRELATSFAVELIRKCVFGDPPVAAPYDFVYSLESLGKLVQEDSSRSQISCLLQDIAVMVKAPQPESQLLRDQITFCFTDWFRLCQYPSISDKLISSFVAQLFQRRFLSDEASARPFFQICTELCIELYVRQRRAPAILAYRSIDAFARLVGQILRFHPGAEGGVGIDPLRIVTIVHSVSGLILIQGLEQGLDYLQRPFARLYVSLAAEILRNYEETWPVIENLSTFYAMISPSVYPSFAFGWFELIINREFLPRLLTSPERRGWPILAQLLSEYLEFSYPLLVDFDAQDSTRALYRGILRSFLVILHDCQDFFVIYGARMSAMIPPSAVQLRNTLLSAVPEIISDTSSLPDPLTASVSTVMSKEADTLSRLAEMASRLSSNMKALAEEYVQNSKNLQVGSQMLALCRDASPQSFHGWSLRSIDCLIAYLGLSTLASVPEGTELSDYISKNSPIVEFIRHAYQECDSYGRYLVICSVVDQLTFPCMTTSLFYSVVICLFSLTESVKESITRVLLERLIVHRPHPWGVMVTFIELVKNPQFRFWELSFTRATPDIERVFEAISRSCLSSSNLSSS